MPFTQYEAARGQCRIERSVANVQQVSFALRREVFSWLGTYFLKFKKIERVYEESRISDLKVNIVP